MQASAIFLLASVGEAFGLVLAEAMACGVPIVGSRSESLTEVVEEKEDMGHRALERVRQNFTVDRDAEGTLGTYAVL